MRSTLTLVRSARAATRGARVVLMTIMLLMMITPFGVAMHPAHAADDDTLSRAREMLRRAQQALQEAQSDNAALSQAKLNDEQKLAALTQELKSARSGSRAARANLQLQLQAAQQAQQATQAELANSTRQSEARLAALSSQQADTAKHLQAREAELAEVQQALARSRTADASCEDKNLKLYGYAEAVLQQYQKKGVWASLLQKEPVLGIKEVGVENVVQEYQQKFDSQKIKQP